MVEVTEDGGFEAEVSAIGRVLSSLEGLSGPARERVIDYVVKALNIRLGGAHQQPAPLTPQAERLAPPVPADPRAGMPIADIRSLKDAKQPTSANQMAALAAYYLQELAPESERSEVIDSTALDRLFRQAGFPLPQRISMTLPNATQAGYFDATGEPGKYRLNPVGYNLVVHGMPSGGEGVARRPATRATTKRASKKAASTKAASKQQAAKKGPSKQPAKKARPKKS